MAPDRIFRSRVDAWLAIVVSGAAAAPLGAALWLAWHGLTRQAWLPALWGGVMVLILLLTALPVRYVLQPDRLVIRSGRLRWEIPYAALRRVRRSASLLAGPAWSLRRVRLDTAEAVILVSPDDRDSFMQELAARCPQLAPGPDGFSVPSPTR